MAAMAKMYWLHALTALHVGAGHGVGFIDLPVMREKTTNWPLVPGSTVKGVMRDYFMREGSYDGLLTTAFGQEGEDSAQAGSLVFTDARLVLLPVRSLYGTFAYVTSPMALVRLKRDLLAARETNVPADPAADVEDVHQPAQSKLVAQDGKVYLEDLDFAAQECPVAHEWAQFLAKVLFASDATWRSLFQARFAILPNDSFDFLCETGTEVNARVRIDDDLKVVADGALWYEESLPAETVLAGVAWCDRVFGESGFTSEQILNTFSKEEIDCQIGGKATVGKGRVRCLFTGQGE